MAKKVYIGTMIEDLKTKIDTMMTKLDAQTTALGNINSGVAQSVNALNVESSAVDKFTINAAKVTQAAPAAGDPTYYCQHTLRPFCNGVIKLKGTIEIVIGAATTRTVSLGYSLNGGSTWTKIGTVSGNGTAGTFSGEVSGNISVTFGTNILIGVCASASTSVTSISLNAGAVVQYDLKDIVNNGAFALV